MHILNVKELSFKYKDKPILEKINITIDRGDIVGLVGENGAGKTTLMKVISGILLSYTGKVEVNTDSIGILIEEPSLYNDMTVLANLKFYCRLYAKPYSKIEEFKDVLNVDKYLNKKVSKLSLGMKQRVGLFVALLASEELILLDEPTNGLDPTGTVELLNLIKKLSHELGITFIISSHILSNLDKICNKSLILKDKQITLIDSSVGQYKVFPYNISQKELVCLFEKGKIEFKNKGKDVIVPDIGIVEKFLKENKVDYYTEAVSLSEVYFNEE